MYHHSCEWSGNACRQQKEETACTKTVLNPREPDLLVCLSPIYEFVAQHTDRRGCMCVAKTILLHRTWTGSISSQCIYPCSLIDFMYLSTSKMRAYHESLLESTSYTCISTYPCIQYNSPCGTCYYEHNQWVWGQQYVNMTKAVYVDLFFR